MRGIYQVAGKGLHSYGKPWQTKQEPTNTSRQVLEVMRIALSTGTRDHVSSQGAIVKSFAPFSVRNAHRPNTDDLFGSPT